MVRLEHSSSYAGNSQARRIWTASEIDCCLLPESGSCGSASACAKIASSDSRDDLLSDSHAVLRNCEGDAASSQTTVHEVTETLHNSVTAKHVVVQSKRAPAFNGNLLLLPSTTADDSQQF